MLTGVLIAAAGLGLHLRVPAGAWIVMDPPAVEAPLAAAQLGLTPPALAASGVTPAQASALLGRLGDAAEERQALASAETAADAAAGEVSRLWELAAASPQDAELQDQLEQAREALASALGSLASAQAALFQEAAEGLSADALARMAAFGSLRDRGLPPELRVVPWTDEEAAGLRRALVAVRCAQRLGEDPPPEAAAVLAAARSDARVIEAEQWLATRLSEIAAALSGS